jgi:hypothetical protein
LIPVVRFGNDQSVLPNIHIVSKYKYNIALIMWIADFPHDIVHYILEFLSCEFDEYKPYF